MGNYMEFYDCRLRSLQHTNNILKFKFFENGNIQMTALKTGVVRLLST